MKQAQALIFRKGTPRGAFLMPAIILSIIALSVVLRLPFLTAPLTPDEGYYAYVAYWWQRGHSLYDTVWGTRPQGVYLAYTLGMKLLGESTEALRLFGALYGSVTCVFVYLIAARFLSQRLGLLAALLYAVLSAHPAIEGFNPNAELYMVLPATISVYLLFTAYRADSTSRGRVPPTAWLVAAGATAGLAFQMKQSGIVALSFALSYVVLEEWLHQPRTTFIEIVKEIVKTGAALLGGFGLVLLPSVVHGLVTAPAGYLDAVIQYRWTGGSFWTRSLEYQASHFLQSAERVVVALAPFLLGAWWAVRMRERLWPLYLWFFWSFLGLAITGDWFVHYYVQLAPPLAVLAAQGLNLLWDHRRDNRGLALVMGAEVVLIGIFVGHALYFYLAPTPEERYLRVSREPLYLISDQVGQYLRERTDPSATVYMAYEGANILYLSRRFSPVRHLSITPLFHAPGAYEELLAMVADPKRRPDYIVPITTLEGPQGPDDTRFQELLATHYVKETTLPLSVYQRRGITRAE